MASQWLFRDGSSSFLFLYHEVSKRPLGFPCGSAGKESACNAGDLGLIPRLGRYPERGKGYPLQYSGLENSTDCIVHGVTKSQTRLSDFHFQGAFTGHPSHQVWRTDAAALLLGVWVITLHEPLPQALLETLISSFILSARNSLIVLSHGFVFISETLYSV